jgi:hypothetical protein
MKPYLGSFPLAAEQRIILSEPDQWQILSDLHGTVPRDGPEHRKDKHTPSPGPKDDSDLSESTDIEVPQFS